MNNKEPFITVMILCYNYGNLLNKALEAIAKQSFKDYSILFIDNGSNDNSKQVFDDFCLRHKYLDIDYLKIEVNKGPAHGWNEGIKVAKGEYVLFNDADDWMEPNCLDVLSFEAVNTGADRVTGSYSEIFPDGSVKRVRKLCPRSDSRVLTPMLQGSIFRKKVIIDNNIEMPENIFGPYDFFFVFSFSNCELTKPVFVNKNIYNYLHNPKSICRDFENRRQNDYSIIYEKFNKPLLEIVRMCIPNIKNNLVKYQGEYLVIRSLYAAIVCNYTIIPVNEAREIYKLIKLELGEIAPNYRHNKYIFPLHNGYEFIGSFAVWIILMFEKIKCEFLFLKLLAFMYKLIKK